MKKILICSINFYKKIISPHLKCSCKFFPTCSDYAILAIKKYGCFRGSIKTIFRIFRCNPFSSGGIDWP